MQSKRNSAFEAATNVAIGLAFTIVSLVRSYLLRRAFNWLES